MNRKGLESLENACFVAEVQYGCSKPGSSGKNTDHLTKGKLPVWAETLIYWGSLRYAAARQNSAVPCGYE